MPVAGKSKWSHRSLGFNVLLAFWQGLAAGLVGVGLALPFGDPAPTWTFVVPAAAGAFWALPTRVTLTTTAVIVRNPLRTYEVALEDVARVEQTQWVSGWRGRTVWLRTNSGRVRVAALGSDRYGAASEALDLMVREQRGHS